MSLTIDDNIATVGMFDGVHLGHFSLISHIKDISQGRPIRVVTFADHPLSVIAPQHAPKLITPPEIKRRLLTGAGVDIVDILNFGDISGLTADQFIGQLADTGTRTIVMGFNNRLGHDRPEGPDAYRDIARRHGVNVIVTPPLYMGATPASSTRIRQHITAGEIEAATSMLGHRFTVSGIVGQGKKIGRTIGYPTANIITPPNQLLPALGVYAGVTTIDTQQYDVMVNIGQRPTVDNSPDTTFEAHIINFEGVDLYGKPLEIALTARVRDTRRFESLEALSRQLDCDKATVRTLNHH